MVNKKRVAIRGFAEQDGPYDRNNHPDADAEPPGHAQVKIPPDSNFYSHLVDLSGEAMYVLVNSRFVFVNARFTEFTGYTVEEILAPDFDFMALIAPASRPLIERRREQIARGETPSLHYAFQAVTKEGQMINVETSVSYLPHNGGLATVGICRDVTDRTVLAEKIVHYEQRHRQFAYLGSDFIYECRRSGAEPFRFIWLEGAFARITGYSREELKESRCWWSLIHSEDAPRVQSSLMGLKHGDRLTLEYRFMAKDGCIRWIEDNALCMATHRFPATYRLYGACRDVTSRKEAELRYKFFAERSFAGVYVVQDGIFRYLNKNAALYAEYEPEELIGSHNNVLVHPEDKAWMRHCAREMLSGQRRTPYEFRIITKKGDVRWIMETVTAFDYEGRPAILGNSMDVTEKMTMENALLESEARYRQLFEGAIEGIYQITPAGRFLQVNPYMAAICGYNSPEAMMRGITNIATQFYIDPKDRKAIREMLEKDGRIENCEYRIRRKDGRIIWISDNARCVRDTAGRVLYYEGRMVEITARKEAERELELHRNHLEELIRERTKGLEREIAEHRLTEEALRREKKSAEAANRAKSDFLSSMSHELRTPLNTILGFTDVLNKKYFGPLNDKQEEYIQDISTSGQHLLALINDLLDLAKIDAGKMDLYSISVSLPELLENSLFMIKEKTRLHGIEVRLEAEERLSGLTVTADARRLKQVMYNLLSNAAKFTPDGGRIAVLARAVDGAADGEKGGGRFIEVSVTDTGFGLAREDLEKVFEEFYQVNPPAAGKNSGTGLGLSLARRIVEMHGGRIWAESAGAGQGSAFIFRIPCASPQDGL